MLTADEDGFDVLCAVVICFGLGSVHTLVSCVFVCLCTCVYVCVLSLLSVLSMVLLPCFGFAQLHPLPVSPFGFRIALVALRYFFLFLHTGARTRRTFSHTGQLWIDASKSRLRASAVNISVVQPALCTICWSFAAGVVRNPFSFRDCVPHLPVHLFFF